MGVPGGYAAAPGSIPVFAGAPQAPTSHERKVWVAIIVVAVLVGGYYYYFWRQKPATATSPVTQTQPGQAQPGGQGQPPPVDNATLVQEQSIAGHWKAIYGFVEVTNAAWTNHASVAILSATMECDQYSANGGQLSQMRTTLNGPVQPGGTATFNPFQMGSVSTYMTRVNCGIVAVTPVS
jgi:hypothetical protein